MRTSVLLMLLLASAASAQTAPAKSAKTKTMTPAEVHRAALLVDTHADTPQRLLDEGFDMASPLASDTGHVDFAKAKAGNLNAEFFSIWVQRKYKGHYAKRTPDLFYWVCAQAD